MIFKIMAAIMDGFVLVPLRFFGTSGGFCLVNSNELVMSLDIFAFKITEDKTPHTFYSLELSGSK